MNVRAAKDKNSVIPATIRIGVTGHRELANEAAVRKGVQAVLSQLEQLVGDTPCTFVAVSPLAEGADRILAQEVLAARVSEGVGKPCLEVVLPLPRDKYLRDFESAESRAQFDSLLARARSIETLPPAGSRQGAYEQVGQYVIDHCDVLVAVWNGEPAAGRGGTAEIVAYARQSGRSLFIVDPQTGEVTPEWGADETSKGLAYLVAFNREGLSADVVQREVKANHRQLSQHAADSGLASDLLQPLCDRLLPMFVRADLLAQRYQSRFTKSGSAVYSLAALAVGIATIQSFFFPQWPGLLVLECLTMAVVLVLILISNERDWHRKWIDYRFLAERLRAALFLSVAGIECELPKPPPHLRLSHRPDDWMIRAFGWIWATCPKCLPVPTASFDALKRFMLTAWVKDQRQYYLETSAQHDQRQRRLERTGWVLFGLTLAAAAIHAAGFAEPLFPERASTGILASIAILFPVIGASAAGIRVHREYLRSSERYRHMAQHLAALIPKMEQAADLPALTDLIQQVNDVMLLENQDWRALILTQELHPG